jgi:mono/diheme cytochrome c family protein
MSHSLLRTVSFVTLVLVAAGAASCSGDSETETPDDTAAPTSTSPYDPQLVAEGERAYQQTCATCHGDDLRGTDNGPPFLDPIYAPNHHPDEAFFAAVAGGVQPHHWDFGPMPPQPNVTPEEVQAILAYIRTEQIEAGITEDPSHQ